jgi:lysophospholipase L1-like esterase
VLLVLLAAALGGAEAWARARYPAESLLPVPEMPFLQDDPVLLWRLRPGVAMPTSPGGPLMHTDALGLRDAEITPKAGRVRIVAVGESTTWGFGVGDAETYPEVLQIRVDPGGTRVDVVNAGQPAWSIWQTWRWLATEGDTLEPDVLVAYHLQNDLLPRGASNRRDVFRVALTDRQLSEARAPFAPVVRVLGQSRLQALAWRHWLAPRVVEGVAGAVEKDVVRVPEADRRLAWEGIRGWCAERGVRLMVVHPLYAGPAARRDALLAEVGAAPETLYVDLPAEKARQGLGERIDGTPMYQSDDAHPTAAGQRWIGGVLADALVPVLAGPS